MIESALSIFNKLISLGLDPAQRLYWPLLLSTLVFCLIYLDREKFVELFSKKGFFHRSSLTDLNYLLLNLVLKVTVFPFILISSFSISVFVLKTLRAMAPNFSGYEIKSFYASLFLTFFAFIINDFLRFSHHYLMHQIPVLKKLHAVHHSAVVLTPLTLFRAHPIEALIAGFRNSLSLGLVIASFSFLSNNPIAVVDILGVNIFGFLFNAIGGNLRHSPIPLSFGVLEYFFISPRMHQIHHSNNPLHFNKNYGVALSIWDQMMGSFYRPTKQDFKNINYGFKFEQKKGSTKAPFQKLYI